MNAIILSGGIGTRIGGKEKAFLRIGRDTFIKRKISLLKPLFNEIIIVTNNPQLYRNLGVRVVKDEKEGVGPLMGLYTGLKNSSSRFNFVTTSDTPLLDKRLVQYLMKNACGCNAVVPKWKGRIEPLCAVYSKKCIPYIRKVMKDGRIRAFFRYVKVKYISQPVLKKIDPEGLSFLNVNTLPDYQRVLGKEQRK